MAPSANKPNDAQLGVMKSIIDTLWDYKDAEGNLLSEVFQDQISKKDLPDYYRVIKQPMALRTMANKTRKKMYAGFADFVRDGCQVFHNAKLYNRPSSQIYADAVTLEGILKNELQRHKNVENPVISAADAEMPDLGPIPEASPTPSVHSEAEDAEEDEEEQDDEDDDEDDEDEDADESDQQKKLRAQRRRTVSKKAADEMAAAADDASTKRAHDVRKKRGRPPRVDTPMESRIKAILKGVRKFRDKSGEPRYLIFEKLPDLKLFPEYYQTIQHPIAIDTLKKRVKRREYKSVDHFMGDVEVMFENAKLYNEDDSDIYKDAALLQKEARKLAEVEKAKNDSEYQGGATESSKHQLRIPLTSIEHKGETYSVGDWIHILNPNDLSKPTVGQIFRTWKDPEGRKWINACWYYRPEQTVHRFDKRFYEYEVAKTGQYRDHHIDEVIDKCFVMFFTKFSRGRPKGIGNKIVYVCECRYNEVEKHFNKIKTWKSCIPDEVRSQDYEMDLFEKQVYLKKHPSPIAHLLPANASEDDPLPEATVGVENAPPVIGAVFKRPRGPNVRFSPQNLLNHAKTLNATLTLINSANTMQDSPPPEATPPPQPVSLHGPPHTPSVHQQSIPRTVSNDKGYQADIHNRPMQIDNKEKSRALQQGVNVIATPQQQRIQPTHHAKTAPPNTYQQYQQQHHQPQSVEPKYHQTITPTPQQAYQQPTHSRTAAVAGSGSNQLNHNNHIPYNPPAPPTAFTVPDVTNFSIPDEIKSQFQCDDDGNMLWFTTPPLNIPPRTSGPEIPNEQSAQLVLSHSAEYLAKLPEIEERRKRAAKIREDQEKTKKARTDTTSPEFQKWAMNQLEKHMWKFAKQTVTGEKLDVFHKEEAAKIEGEAMEIDS